APNLRNSLSASLAPSATRRRPPLVPPVVERTASVPATRKSALIHSPTPVDSVRTPSTSAPHPASLRRQRIATTTKPASPLPMVRSVPRTTASVLLTAMSAVASSLRPAGSPLLKSILVSRARIPFSRRIVVPADALQPKDPPWQQPRQPSKELQPRTSVSRIHASVRRRVMLAARPSPRSASTPRTPYTAAKARMQLQQRRSSASRICASQQLATTNAIIASVPQAELSRSVDRTFLWNAVPTVTPSTTARQALIRGLSRLVFAHQELSVWMESATMMPHAVPLTVIALATWKCAPTPSLRNADCSPTPSTSALPV
ncbi:hypothetical protein BGX24_007201, partial [Mortierella sp. AD032]